MLNIHSVSKNSFMMLLCLFLTACNNKLSYDYLVLHPHTLEKAYSECQMNDTPSCQEIKRAAHDMGELIYEQAADPEEFGKKIIALQQQLQLEQKQNKDARNIYDEHLKKLQIMYAIVASHGPE